jgi:hypothetical protein
MLISLLARKPYGLIKQVDVVDVKQVGLAFEEIVNWRMQLFHKASFRLKNLAIKLTDTVGLLQPLRHSFDDRYFAFCFRYLLSFIIELG